MNRWAFLGGVLVSCATILDLEPPPDASLLAFDAMLPDVGSTSDAGCAPLDAMVPGADVQSTYPAFNQGALINDAGYALSAFDLTTVSVTASGYSGGTFDGQFLYLAPSCNCPVMRYAVTQPFEQGTSWSTFNAASVVGPAGAFSGAVFDGRYVTFVPLNAGGSALRYDTTVDGGFDGGAAWASFPTTNLTDAGAMSFQGDAFDGRYVYLVPNRLGTAGSGLVARFDTQGPTGTAGDASINAFDNLANWQTFDITKTGNSAAVDYTGAVFDGSYVYFVPVSAQANVARYDISQPFGQPSSWATFDTADNVDSNAFGFVGAAFDGQFVYLVPHTKSLATRYDTHQPFASAAAWSTFDLSTVVSGPDGGLPSFSGAGFDGRFVYFIPEVVGAAGSAVRYDTLSTFTSGCAWSSLDLTEAIPNGAKAGYQWGAVFDGHFLYVLPRSNIILRWLAKYPTAMPSLPGYHGSFY